MVELVSLLPHHCLGARGVDEALAELVPPVGSEGLLAQGLHSQGSLGSWPDRVVGEVLEESHFSSPCHLHLQPGAGGRIAGGGRRVWWQRRPLPKSTLDPLVGCPVRGAVGVHDAQMAPSLSPRCLSAPGELNQRDAHREGRSPEGAGPGGAGDPHREESSSSGDQSSSGAWVVAGPEHLGTGPWGAVVGPVELAQPPWSQAAVVMGALGQLGQSPVGAAATVAASGAAPAAAAGSEEAMTSDTWGSLNPG